MSSDTLKKRYSYKLITNFIGFFLSLVTAGIIPRSLGVENYGNFNFVTSILRQIVTLLDFRASTYFFTKLSQRQNDNNLISFYFYYLTFILVFLFAIIFLIINSSLNTLVFPSQSKIVIIYSGILILLEWYSDFFVRILDARGATVSLEKNRIVNKIITTIFMIILFFMNSLNIITFFYYQYITTLLLILILYKYSKIGLKLFSLQIFKVDLRKSFIKEFFTYSGPLGFYVVLQFFQVTFDRWLLQKTGGSFEQGLYSFSFNFSNFSFIFISAIIPLFTRELSVSIGNNDIKKSARLFRQYVPMLYVFTAYICAFTFREIFQIINMFGGKDYLSAAIPLKILAFYPLISVYSNLNGSVIYASGNTKIFYKFSLIFTPISILLSLILLNKNIVGLSLGATGLALKNVFLELVTVLIILKINSNYLKISFNKYLFHMIFSVFPFICMAYISHYFISLLSPHLTSYFAFFSSGFLYTILVSILIWKFPIIIGQQKENLILVYNDIKYKILPPK